VITLFMWVLLLSMVCLLFLCLWIVRMIKNQRSYLLSEIKKRNKILDILKTEYDRLNTDKCNGGSEYAGDNNQGRG